jgi:Domain of unknown function (DUF1906)
MRRRNCVAWWVSCVGVVVFCMQTGAQERHGYAGFDRNDYPGDAALPTLRKSFSFVGYWLTNPPGADTNNWQGKREILMRHGFGFLVLANGREEAEIKTAQTGKHVTAIAQGQMDGQAAAAAARREHFPAETIVYLDQEEGGRLTDDQAGYIKGWAESLSERGYRPGIYGSGQPVSEGGGRTITTAQDLRARVASHFFKEKIALWVYQDACPPSNGCKLQPPLLEASGTPGAAVWQYAQSPRRKEITSACAKTYATDGNCYVPELPGLHLDLNVADSPDPSHGR